MKKALVCSICRYLGCKYFHFGKCQTANVMSLKKSGQMHGWVLGAQVGSGTPPESHLAKDRGQGSKVHRAPRVSGAGVSRSSSTTRVTPCLDAGCLQSWDRPHDPTVRPAPGTCRCGHGTLARKELQTSFCSVSRPEQDSLKNAFGRWSSGFVPWRGALVLLAVWFIGELAGC